jgi:hypothetical protein
MRSGCESEEGNVISNYISGRGQLMLSSET